MLIDFIIGNYCSVADPVVLDLERTRKFDELRNNSIHVVENGDKQREILKSAIIYGPNGGGKSTILNAFNFVYQFVVPICGNIFQKDAIGRANLCKPICFFRNNT